MIMVGNKEWDKLKDDEKISYCEGLLEDAKQAREKRDLEWYLNKMFEDGNHYLTYNTSSVSIEANPPRTRGEVRMVVNKVRSSKRAIQNYVTAARPKWEIVPGDIDEDTIVTARRIGKVMDYLYRRLHLEGMVTGAVDSVLNTSIAWAEVDWDPDAERGLGQVRIRLHDPFDIWIDKRASIYRGRVESKFMAKTIVKSVDEVKSDERYDKKEREKVDPDEDLAVSRLKAKILRKDYSSQDKDEVPRVIVKEFYLWDYNPKGKKRIKLFTYANNHVLREEDLDLIEYPIYPYQVSLNPLQVYQRSWMADAIPLNKALDRNVSQKIMFANQALVWRVIAEKGHGVNVFSNESGEILEINKGRNFEQWRTAALPYGFDSLSDELNQYIEDILGAHDAALGRLPAGARSGKTLEALQAADANNLTGLTASLESFLAVLGERVLEIIAEKYVTSRIVKIAEPEEGQEYMRVAGENAKRKEDSVVITQDNEVMVTIGSWLGHTKEAQRETLFQLAELGILPGEEVLRYYEFPNVEELSQMAREQRLEQHQMDLAVAGRNQAAGGEPQAGGTNIDMEGLADKENLAMMNGEQIPPTEGADMTHTQTHLDFIKTDTFQSAPDEIKQLLAGHAQGELQAQGVA